MGLISNMISILGNTFHGETETQGEHQLKRRQGSEQSNGKTARINAIARANKGQRKFFPIDFRGHTALSTS